MLKIGAKKKYVLNRVHIFQQTPRIRGVLVLLWRFIPLSLLEQYRRREYQRYRQQ